jgi:hypothetical protein
MGDAVNASSTSSDRKEDHGRLQSALTSERPVHRRLPDGSWEQLQPILSPSFSYLDGATGEVWTLERYIESLRANPSPSLTIDQVIVHVDGNTAVVSARTSRPGRSGRYVVTYEQRSSGWECVHASVWPVNKLRDWLRVERICSPGRERSEVATFPAPNRPDIGMWFGASSIVDTGRATSDRLAWAREPKSGGAMEGRTVAHSISRRSAA